MTRRTPRRRARRAPLAVALAAALAVLACGCGDPDAGTNGLGRLPAGEIEHRTKAAVDGAAAVHLTGDLVARGQTYRLDIRLKRSGATGSVTTGAGTFDLLRVGDALFLKADGGFWSRSAGAGGAAAGESRNGGSTVADKLRGKYVRVPADDPSYRQLRGFTDMRALLGRLLVLGGRPAKGDRGRTAGMRTIQLNGGGGGGALDVSLEGAPYPLRLVRAGGAGTVRLGEWGKDFPLAAPAGDETVDYGSQLPHA